MLYVMRRISFRFAELNLWRTTKEHFVERNSVALTQKFWVIYFTVVMTVLWRSDKTSRGTWNKLAFEIKQLG